MLRNRNTTTRTLKGRGRLALFTLALTIAPVIFADNAAAQYPDSATLGAIATVKPQSHLIHYNPDSSISAAELFQVHGGRFGLGQYDRMVLIDSTTDDFGYQRYKCQQLHRGVPVKGATYTLVEDQGRLIYSKGLIKPGIETSNQPALTKLAALQYALDHIGATTYAWQDPSTEGWLKMMREDSTATFFPAGSLLVAAPFENDSAGYDPTAYRLCYLFDIRSIAPTNSQRLFVDAETGEIVRLTSLLYMSDETGVAMTFYNGLRSITTDSHSGSFRTRESGRGKGIRTWDMNQQSNESLADYFYDADNNWTTTTNLDDAAWGAEWAMEETYDYYSNVHGRNSFSGGGQRIHAYIHYDTASGTGWLDNAWYDGGAQAFYFGDGTDGTLDPVTTLDIIGHEFTHGVIDHESNLEYANQSGALNESFADMLGEAIEARSLGSSDWVHGGDSPTPSRILFDPTLINDPATFMVDPNWVHGPVSDPKASNDWGGVHTNSSVGNYWFYLLSEGGSGTNARGDAYTVSGIGIIPAARIAYLTLLDDYLWEEAGFRDAFDMSVQAAKDEFGICSDEHQETVKAWYAVGICDTTTFKWADVTATGLVDSREGMVIFGDGHTIHSTAELESRSMLKIIFKPESTIERGAYFHAKIGCNSSCCW